MVSSRKTGLHFGRPCGSNFPINGMSRSFESEALAHEKESDAAHRGNSTRHLQGIDDDRDPFLGCLEPLLHLNEDGEVVGHYVARIGELRLTKRDQD
jgi:hypothetical protein